MNPISTILIVVISLIQIQVTVQQVLPYAVTSKPDYNQYEPTYISYSSPNQCTGFNCVEKGELCNADISDNNPLPCTGKVGEKCCKYGLECIAEVCELALESSGSPGDTCYPPTPCNGADLNVQCVKGKCVGIDVGGFCNVSTTYAAINPCVYGSYCWNGVCTAMSQDGQACNLWDCSNGFYNVDTTFGCDQCGYGSYCDLTSVTCQKRYTKSLGEKCFSYDYPCQSGLSCLNGVCSNSNSEKLLSTCKTQSDCGNSSTSCTCNAMIGEGQCTANYLTEPSSPCVSYIQEYQECAVKHSCQDPSQLFTDYSYTSNCALKHCSFEYSNLRACSCQKVLKPTFGNCLYNGKLCTIKKFRTWQLALIIVGGIVGFGILLGVCAIFVIRRTRKHNYQQIQSHHGHH